MLHCAEKASRSLPAVGINEGGSWGAVRPRGTVERHRETCFCLREIRSTDFQQLNGRNVGIPVAIATVYNNLDGVLLK